MSSIRRDLTVALIGAIALGVLRDDTAIYHAARSEVDELLDYQLRQLALSVRDQSFRPEWATPEGDQREADFAVQVWGPDGINLYFSHPHRTLPVATQLGYATIETGDGAWRVYATRTRTRLIQVAQPMTVRNAMAWAGVTRVLTPMLLTLPLLSLLIWVMVGRGLAPLRRLAIGVATRTPDSLSPLPLAGTPDEAVPLVTALNNLLHRLDEALAVQKAFVADAAHELRTPMTALQLQAELLARARTEAERHAALEELQAGMRRAAHLVSQLLTLARQEPAWSGPTGARVDLAALVRSAVTEHAPFADARDIDLGLTRADQHACVQGDEESLRILLRNLIDNALRYTPPGGRVDVAVIVSGAGVRLDVTDTGPGIPADERGRVFDRFYRGSTVAEAGTGLGLSIVKSIAERHGAAIELDTAATGGLWVRVQWPRNIGLP